MAKVLCLLINFWVILACLLVTGHPLHIFSNNEGDYLAYSTDYWGHQSAMSSHILLNPEFWRSFENEVQEKKAWKCVFPRDILYKNIESDAKLYDDSTMLRNRRNGMSSWLKNDSLWATTILGASKEIALGKRGIFLKELEKYGLVSTLEDYIEHLHYFYTVASVMEARGEKVIVLSQKTSNIHDIDKLDPIMLIGYSERFEDNHNTSLWNACVDRHTHVNPHHQAHCLWHDNCQIRSDNTCDELGNIAVKEMVCDKVSRRLQKNLNGTVSEAMWETDIGFFAGLPQKWLNKAKDLLQRMKDWNKLAKNAHYSV